jgi:hypothetical protein
MLDCDLADAKPTELSAHLAQLVGCWVVETQQNDHPGPAFSPVVRPVIGLAQQIYTAIL